MNPSPTNPSDDPLAEELVAYLDGELSAAECESMERRISDDERARGELQMLDRVWNALDELPRATVDDSFTKTTIEMAALEAEKELVHETAMMPVRRRSRWLKTAGLATAAAIVGFAAIAALTPNPNRQLYANLPVIQQLDAYSEVRDLDFLRLLGSESGSWLLAEWGPEVQGDAAALTQLTSATYGERRSYVEELPAEGRADLAGKHRRYESLTPPMQQELNDWHTTVAAQPDAAELQQAMLAYYAWVSKEDESDQARLRLLAAEPRLERMEQMRSRDLRANLWQLDAANTLALREAIDAMVSDPEITRLHRAMIESLPSTNALKLPDRERDWRLMRLKALKESSPRLAILMIEMAAAWGDREPPIPNFKAYRDAIETRLIDALDETQAARLQEMTPQDRSRQLARWLAVTARRERKPDVATLEEFFVSGNLSPDVQQQLLAMPREQMLEHLERMYIEEFLGEKSLSREFNDFMRGFGRSGERRGWDNRNDREQRGERGPGERVQGDRSRRGGPPPRQTPGPAPAESDSL